MQVSDILEAKTSEIDRINELNFIITNKIQEIDILINFLVNLHSTKQIDLRLIWLKIYVMKFKQKIQKVIRIPLNFI